MSETITTPDPVTVLKAAAARRAAAGQPQTDLEEFTGNPGQEAREAEVGGIAADRLRSLIERIEKLECERKALAGDVKDIFTEAASAGFSVKALRAVLRERAALAKDEAAFEEQKSLTELYMRALGA